MQKVLQIVIFFFLTNSCSNKVESNVPNPDSGKVVLDSVEIKHTVDSISVDSVVDLEVIELTNLKTNIGLAYQMDYLHDTWDSIPNPIIAFYAGADIGDYFYLSFVDDSGLELDFGDGNNNLEPYILYNDNFETNPEYKGKLFQIHWEWKISTFACCGGEMTAVTQKVPSIVQLKLVN